MIYNICLDLLQHPDMVGFNPFIREHKQSMLDLMDRFVSQSEGKTLPEIEIERLSIITEDSGTYFIRLVKLSS